MENNFSKHTTPENLERYSFLWSQARLVIGAVSLLIGGIPLLSYLVRSFALYGLVNSLLTLSWIISGVASAYLLYLWNKNGRRVFGGTDRKDQAAFFISVITGINLGLTGLLGRNIGMSIFASKVLWIIGGIIYLATAYYLHKRWKQHGEKLF